MNYTRSRRILEDVIKVICINLENRATGDAAMTGSAIDYSDK